MGVLRSAVMPTDHKNMRSIFHYTTDGEVVVEQSHNVDGIMRANHHARSQQSFKHNGEVFNHYATIDYLAIKTWCAVRGITKGWWREFNRDPRLLREFMNDPDNKAWRTRLGKV